MVTVSVETATLNGKTLIMAKTAVNDYDFAYDLYRIDQGFSNCCLKRLLSQRKRRCLGHILRHEGLLLTVLEGSVVGRTRQGYKRTSNAG